MSERLTPGETDTVTMFERCTLLLTTGTLDASESARGTWALAGSASSTRCRCRVIIAVRRARLPSVQKSADCGDVDVEGVPGVDEAEKVAAAAA